MNTKTTISALALIVAVICCCIMIGEAKLLRRSRFYDDPYDSYGPYGGVATGERAIMTVRGARNPYDGTAPAKIKIEDNPYRGPFPHGVYDRIDGYGRYPPRPDFGYPGGPYGGSPYGGHGYGMYGAPNRIAVTGAYPYGYGSRFP